MKEQHYIVDSIPSETKPSEYLTECQDIDTRLIKMYTGNGEYFVIRPPSLEENRRLEYPKESYFEIKDNFNLLLDEMKQFDFKIPTYHLFVSDIHTKEGQKGQGLCIASEYIHGKCLPMENCNGLWDNNKTLYYKNMNKWLENISEYMAYKYLAKEESPKFLTDVARPIQFVFSFDDSQIYLVDLDPLYSNILDKDGNVNTRFLVCLETINSIRNTYFNRGYKEGYIDKNWGDKSKEILKNFLFKTDILERIAENKYSESIVRNLIRGLEYSNQKKVDSPKVQR